MTKESRAQTIWRHVHRFINSTTASWPTFASFVREVHEDTVPLHARRVHWSSHRDAHERMRLDAQTLRRFEHDVKFGLPCELEEAMVITLQEMGYDGQRQLEAELCARYGMLPARIPDGQGIGHVGDLAQQFGEAIQMLAPIVADGRIDQRDIRYAPRAIKELNDVIAAATSVVEQVSSIMSGEPKARAV